jgi:hypothetical protein
MWLLSIAVSYIAGVGLPLTPLIIAYGILASVIFFAVLMIFNILRAPVILRCEQRLRPKMEVLFHDDLPPYVECWASDNWTARMIVSSTGGETLTSVQAKVVAVNPSWFTPLRHCPEGVPLGPEADLKPGEKLSIDIVKRVPAGLVVCASSPENAPSWWEPKLWDLGEHYRISVRVMAKISQPIDTGFKFWVDDKGGLHAASYD